MKIYKLVSKYIYKSRISIFAYICISILLSVLGLIIPYLSGIFIDTIIKHPTSGIIYKFVLVVVIISLLQLIFSYFTAVFSTKIKTTLSYQFNKDTIIELQNSSLLYLDKKNVAYLNQRVNADCSNLINFSMIFLNGVVINVVTFIIYFVVIIKINFNIGILIMFLIISYILLYGVMRHPLLKYTLQLKEITATYISRLQEQLQDIRLIKIFNLFNFFSHRMDKCFKEFKRSNIKMTKINFLFQSSDIMIKMVAQVLLFLIGGFQIIDGNLTIGLFTILSSYFNSLINCVKFLMNLVNQFISNTVSANRIIEIQKIDKEHNGDIKINNIDRLNVDNLNFGYDDNLILYHFNYRFIKGKLYKVSGKNGKGKSTLISVLIGLYPDKYTGDIFYNDVELREIDMLHMRKNNISYIGQNHLFFNGTVRENINSNYDVDRNKIVQYLEMFSFESYDNLNIDKFLNLEINDSNLNFSGGELEKISIIRGLVKPCSILILDEPTNSLDVISKEKLREVVADKKNEVITILISHDDTFDSLIDYEIQL